MDRTVELPNSSKQPTWTPARMTTESSASAWTIGSPAVAIAMSISPVATDGTMSGGALSMYWTVVKPSARSRSFATDCGANQMAAFLASLMVEVSGAVVAFVDAVEPAGPTGAGDAARFPQADSSDAPATDRPNPITACTKRRRLARLVE